jgi:hypothetical protein
MRAASLPNTRLPRPTPSLDPNVSKLGAPLPSSRGPTTPNRLGNARSHSRIAPIQTGLKKVALQVRKELPEVTIIKGVLCQGFEKGVRMSCYQRFAQALEARSYHAALPELYRELCVIVAQQGRLMRVHLCKHGAREGQNICRGTRRAQHMGCIPHD